MIIGLKRLVTTLRGLCVMSRERELLKRVRDTLLGLKETHYDLYWDIQTALDLREDLREGVVGYLYKQMDCHGEWATIFKVDKPYITWHDIKDIVPLYTAPPKREPLSFEDLNTMWCGNPIDFARRIESIHGIGGGE